MEVNGALQVERKERLAHLTEAAESLMLGHAPSGEALDPGRKAGGNSRLSQETPEAAPPHREINCLPSAAASRTWQVAS